ncbi:alkylhydroperoxidase AhpD family core domain-containing protein [Nonomuraea solani]|uniref:Alkylhydroperoxidase AhpD family core domain-containing protein n=1 Tax=Nonomuraea solani TaxID=1144553 RepID=A0A1H6DTX8_9ACTN|nr:carboxymuconolactone decarboxylase family protein [Nonomuraea solani]SEG88689.1 alkylhydroperoxidase AhpD family core domain-containing protein [Nonomuraea solani]
MPEASIVTRLAIKEVTPDVSTAMIALNDAAQSAAEAADIEPELLQLIRIRTSQINGCSLSLVQHTAAARAMGQSEQRIRDVRAWRNSKVLDRKERAALALTEAITLVFAGQVPNSVYAEAACLFDETQLAALIWIVTVINTHNRIAITTRLEGSGAPPTAAAG